MALSGDKLHNLTDKELWVCFQKDHLKAFSVLFRRHYRVLYSYGLKISQDEDLTKDCIQETFAELWNKRAELPEVAAVKPYLFTILRRRIFNAKQVALKQSMQDWQYQNYEFDLVISHEDFLVQQHVSDYKQIKLQEALTKLSPRQKEVIYLRFFDGLSCEAIAEITGVKYQSVVNSIHEAVKKLREHIAFTLPLVILILDYFLVSTPLPGL